MVSRELASMCRGEVVDEAFARSTEDRRARDIASQLRTEHQQSSDASHLGRIGTAFFIDGQARLLTANHVIEGCKKVTIVDKDHREIDANILAVDRTADIAMLAAAVSPVAIANFGPLTMLSDDRFVAIVGFADQGLPPLEPILASGRLLKTADEHDARGNLVFSADVRQGDSGGPMFDSRGSVIGIVKAKADTVRTFRETGREIEDIGLATGLPTVFDFLNRNNVSHQEKSGGKILDRDELLTAASKFVVRTECWN